ncbi:MAG: hypothetical protein KJ623_02150 [Nanoarchaeota archaeon]|nr:hypothetical protein [Nanoarchaeota archaeon]MBU0962774.1 hypothetical protein [Nanoarchaeota archaeon]
MKKLLTILLVAMFLALPMALAEELATQTTSDDQIVLEQTVDSENLSDSESQDIAETIQESTESTEEVSVTPDMSLRWGLKTWSEKLSLLLTFNKFKKAEKKLEQAKERLQEMKQMAEKKNLKALARAQKAHALLVVELAEDEETIANENLTAAQRIEVELQKHMQILENVQAKLAAKGVSTQGVDTALVKSRNAMEKFQNISDARKAKLSEKVQERAEERNEIREGLNSSEFAEQNIEENRQEGNK